jgi:flagellar hook-associated protein 2
MAVDYLSAINSGGSGLNITQIVESLVEAETAPQQDAVNKKIDGKTLEISALGEVAKELNLLKTPTALLANKTKLSVSSASTTNTISITSPSVAKTFSSDLTVSSLATPQTLEFTGFTSPTQSVGSGNITVDFGNWISGGAATDTDSLFASNTNVNASTSLGTPTSHSKLGGVITIATGAGGNHSSSTFTVVGTDMAGNAITENITGAADGATSTGSKVFKTVTSITPGSSVGSGTVTVGHVASTFGLNSSKTSSTAVITSGSDSLNSVATGLNAITGVSASIINKGDGTYSLIIRSDTGANSALRLTVSEEASNTGLSTFNTTTDNANHQKTAASDATLNVDGVTINRETNIIDDLYDGYTLNLTTTTSSSFRLSSSLDKVNALSNLQSFIDVINETRTNLNILTQSKSDTEDSGPLAKNVTVNSLKNRLNSITTGPIYGFGSDPLYLSELGVRTEKDGTLSVNKNTFNNQIAFDSSVFDAVFNTMFSSSSPFIKAEKSIASSEPKPGAYGFQSTDSTTASLDGTSMIAATATDGTKYFLSSSSAENTSGIKITQSETVSSAYVYFGKSLIDQIGDYLTDTLSVNGTLAKSETAASSDLSSFNIDLSDIDKRVDSLTIRYKSQFASMESAVTSLKSTGEYLTNMMDSWNKDY